MAKDRRNKKKLNSKQANRITLVICAIYFIFAFVMGIILKPTGEEAFVYWSFECIIVPMLVYISFYYVIFNGVRREKEEQIEKIEIVNAQYLSYTEFKQVYFTAKNYRDGIVDMMKQILEKEGYEFYAKLTESNNIYLIVKDKNDKEVDSVKISNLLYFKSNFRFEE